MARSHSTAIGRLGTVAASAAVAVAGLVTLAAPAQAATVPPWHWSQVTGTATLTWYSSQTVTLACPSGYVPVSGGFSATDGGIRLKGQHADAGTNSYVFELGNGTGLTQTATVNAWCAGGTEVGSITTSSHTSVEVAANARIGAQAECPDPNPYDNYAPYVAIGGDAEWKSAGARTIEFLSPDDYYSWIASGTTATGSDQLTVTVRCVPSSFAVQSAYNSASVGAGSHSITATCPAGTRVLTGGSQPVWVANGGWADHGYTSLSVPSRTSWTTTIHSVGADTITVRAICIATDAPMIAWTSAPPSHSNTATGHLTFSTSDPFGEAVSTSCTLDGAPVGCQSGSPVAYGPLAEGGHSFSVDAVNSDGEHVQSSRTWTVDLTAPTATSTAPGADAPVTTTFDASFSELVSGLDPSTFTVVAAGDDQPTEGAVTTATTGVGCPNSCTKATFTPSSSLLGHRDYTATLTSGIHDLAGNPLTSTSWTVHTSDVAPTCTDVSAGTTAVNTVRPVQLTCSDHDGDALDFTVTNGPAHGQLTTPDATGAVTYTPDAGYVGADSFTFDASDGYGGTSPSASVTVAVGPNHTPVCHDVARQVGYEAATSIALSCDDADTGQQLTFTVDSNPAHGGVGPVGPDGTVTYTPYPGFSGQDSFTYHAADGYGGSAAVQTVTLDVAADAPPTCTPASLSVKHATAVSVPLSCTDPDSGQTLTLAIDNPPAHGALTNLGAGAVTYTPKTSYGGTDTFTYTASDGHGGASAPATVTLKVAPGATSLTLRAKAMTITAGTGNRLTSRLRDTVTGRYLNGQTVLLQSRGSTSEAWSTLTRATTQTVDGATGTAAFTVQPAHSRYYRVVFRGTSAFLSSLSSSLHVMVTG